MKNISINDLFVGRRATIIEKSRWSNSVVNHNVVVFNIMADKVLFLSDKGASFLFQMDASKRTLEKIVAPAKNGYSVSIELL